MVDSPIFPARMLNWYQKDFWRRGFVFLSLSHSVCPYDRATGEQAATPYNSARLKLLHTSCYLPSWQRLWIWSVLWPVIQQWRHLRRQGELLLINFWNCHIVILCSQDWLTTSSVFENHGKVTLPHTAVVFTSLYNWLLLYSIHVWMISPSRRKTDFNSLFMISNSSDI